MRGDNERIYIVVCPLFNTPVTFFEIPGDRNGEYYMLITVVPLFVSESEF